MKRLEKIYSDIKEIKIQGATNIAKAAVDAYLMKPDAENKKRLMSLRPTEPMLSNALKFLERLGKKKVLSHFSEAQSEINRLVFSVLKEGVIVYTHCHSTNVVKALIYAKEKGKKFEVYNTETRPLFQGRKTAKELAKHGIKATTFVDSALHEAIKKADIVLLGADAILKDAAINKIGSGAAAEIAFVHKKPLYIIADSWKFSPKNVTIEERDFHEVWKNAPRRIKIRNPAFEKIEKKYIKGIISELGALSFDDFVKAAGQDKG
jgi:translation initiation factor 2B subunit (eIF-2B alpha/beta/delta family)